MGTDKNRKNYGAEDPRNDCRMGCDERRTRTTIINSIDSYGGDRESRSCSGDGGTNDSRIRRRAGDGDHGSAN